jgi:hypothetical protein
MSLTTWAASMRRQRATLQSCSAQQVQLPGPGRALTRGLGDPGIDFHSAAGCIRLRVVDDSKVSPHRAGRSQSMIGDYVSDLVRRAPCPAPKRCPVPRGMTVFSQFERESPNPKVHVLGANGRLERANLEIGARSVPEDSGNTECSVSEGDPASHDSR